MHKTLPQLYNVYKNLRYALLWFKEAWNEQNYSLKSE